MENVILTAEDIPAVTVKDLGNAVVEAVDQAIDETTSKECQFMNQHKAFDMVSMREETDNGLLIIVLCCMVQCAPSAQEDWSNQRGPIDAMNKFILCLTISDQSCTVQSFSLADLSIVIFVSAMIVKLS